jgi:NTE family protein
MNKVQLVLGSGGARGVAHIGVIEMLEKEGYEIVEVAGSSMGAVVGGMYAAGFLQEYKTWLLSLTRANVFSLFDFTLTTNGFVKGEKVFEKVKQITGQQNIEELKIPFIAVATDLLSRKEIHFKEGNLFHALRASTAIPGVFTPVKSDGQLLVDGGVSNPLPLSIPIKREDAIVVAVDVNACSEPLQQSRPAEEQPVNDVWKWLNKISLPSIVKSNEDQKQETKLSFLDLLNTSYDFTQDRLAELMKEVYKPDLLIEIPRNTCSIFDYHKAKDLIQKGREKYVEAKAKMINK